MSFSIIDLSKRYDLTEDDLVRMNVGSTFWRCQLATVPDGCAYKKAVQAWIAKMPEMLKKGVGMMFHGDFRQGKTGAAVICLKAVATHGGTGYMLRADEVAGVVVRNTRFDEDMSVEERCMDVDLLVVDELGKGGHEQSTGMVERLLRHRYDRGKAMVVTVNDLKLVEGKYGRGTAMLLRSRCQPVEVKGTPFWEGEKQEVAEMFGDGNGKK